MLLLIDKNPSSILSVFDFTQKVKPRFGYHFEIEQENKKAEYSLIRLSPYLALSSPP